MLQEGELRPLGEESRGISIESGTAEQRRALKPVRVTHNNRSGIDSADVLGRNTASINVPDSRVSQSATCIASAMPMSKLLERNLLARKLT